MIQYQNTNPPKLWMSAHQGIMSGFPAQVICVQSNVIQPMPMPDATPKTWFIGMLLGRIQHTHEKTPRAVKR